MEPSSSSDNADWHRQGPRLSGFCGPVTNPGAWSLWPRLADDQLAKGPRHLSSPATRTRARIILQPAPLHRLRPPIRVGATFRYAQADGMEKDAGGPMHSDGKEAALSLIKTAMIEKKMTQAELADAADIHEKTIQNL